MRTQRRQTYFCVFFLLAPSFHFACQFGAAHPDGNLGRPSVRLLAVGMFLWWTKKVDGSDDTIEDKQHEINELKHELTTATLTRPSPISKSRYGKYVVTEENRAIGMQARADSEELISQREEARRQFLEGMSERTQACRAQREAAAERVRQHKARMLTRGTEMKTELEEKRETMTNLKATQHQQQTRTVMTYGAELRERVLESKAEKEESRRNNAIQHKQAVQDRAETKQQRNARKLQEKRLRVARIREETKPEVSISSREFFFHRRLDIANDVRQSVKDWKTEAEYRTEESLARAKETRNDGMLSFRNAIDGKIALRETRRQEAIELRNSLKLAELHREHSKLSLEHAKRELHDEAFESKFVQQNQAQVLAESQYDAVANQHRDDLAAKGGAISERRSKPEWVTFFGNTHHDGFFNGWFSW